MILYIVIPSFNRKSILSDLLNQIIVQKKTANYQIEIIPVIDGSTDGTIEMISKDFKNIIPVLGDGSWYFTKSINEGVKESLKRGANYILTLNDDVILEESFFLHLNNYLFEIPKREIIGMVSYSDYNKNQITSPGVKNIIWWKPKLVTYFKHKQIVNSSELSGTKFSMVLPTRGLLIPSEIIKELDYLDEQFPQYFSDYDFCLRALKAGVQNLISYDVKLFTMDDLTQKSTNTQNSLLELIKSLSDKYSRNYWKHVLRYYWRHGNRPFIMITVLSIYTNSFLKVLKNKVGA